MREYLYQKFLLSPTLTPLEAVAALLDSSIHPMYLVQSLMSNVPRRDPGALALASLLGLEWHEDDEYGPLALRVMMPETYGFCYGAVSATAR